MANPICISPLKFYDDFHKQNRYRSFAYGHVAPLITTPNVVSPFQLIVSGNVSEVYVRSADTNKRVTGIKQCMQQDIEFQTDEKIDLNKAIKTSVGTGIIDSLSVNIDTQLISTTLVYSPH